MTSTLDTPQTTAGRPRADVLRCVIYDRISYDKAGDAHGVLNQRGELRRRAASRGWTVVAEKSDNDVGVTRSIADALGEGRHRPGWGEVLRLVDARAVDVVLVWRWDRALREPIDLERLIPRFDAARVRFAEADGVIDLGTDSGRMAARILVAVAKAEQERKSERQKLANAGAAKRGERRKGGARQFGWTADRSAQVPEEAEAIRAACRRLLSGPEVTMTHIVAEWTLRAHGREVPADGGAPDWSAGGYRYQAGYRPPHAPFGPLRRKPWTFAAVRSILLHPANAGLSAYRGEIVAEGNWKAIVSPETQKAVAAKLASGPRAAPEGRERRAGRSLLGSLALCPCGSVVYAAKSSAGLPVYRCAAAMAQKGLGGRHVTRQAADPDDWVRAQVIERCDREDAADLLIREEEGPDLDALSEEAKAIRASLDELAADKALGLLTRSQLLAATARGTGRLAEIDAVIQSASREDPAAPLITAGDTAAAWDALDLAARRAAIARLATVTLLSPGRGRKGFDPATVRIDWTQRLGSDDAG